MRFRSRNVILWLRMRNLETSYICHKFCCSGKLSKLECRILSLVFLVQYSQFCLFMIAIFWLQRKGVHSWLQASDIPDFPVTLYLYIESHGRTTLSNLRNRLWHSDLYAGIHYIAWIYFKFSPVCHSALRLVAYKL